MAKKNAQKIRQAKQQKRKTNKLRKGPAQIYRASAELTVTEMAQAFLTLPELTTVRFDRDTVRECVEELDEAISRCLPQLRENPAACLGPSELGLFRRVYLQRLVHADLASQVVRAAELSAHHFPELRKQLWKVSDLAKAHLDGTLEIDDNPLWAALFLIAMEGLEQPLRMRGAALWPDAQWPIVPISEETLAEVAGCTPDDVRRMKAAVDSADHHADEPEYAQLAKLRARLGALVGGVTPAELEEAVASVLFGWARRQTGSPLARRLAETVPETAELPELALAILGGYLPNGPDFLLEDPDSPDWEFGLADSCLAEGRLELARFLLEPLAEEHPDFFDTHLLMARCLKGEGKLEEARAEARWCLDELEKQRTSLADEAYRLIRAEAERI